MDAVVYLGKLPLGRPTQPSLLLLFQPLKVAHQIYFKFRADPHSKLKSDVFVSVGSAIAPGSGFEADSIGFLYIFLNANPESVQPGLVSN